MTTANELRLDHSAAATQNGPSKHFDVPIVGARLSGIGAPFIALRSGYMRRGIDRFPRQGARTPWRLHQNYRRDVALLRRQRTGHIFAVSTWYHPSHGFHAANRRGTRKGA